MHAELSDFHIQRLISTARSILKSRRDDTATCLEFIHYLHIKSVITDAMNHRRKHREAVAHVWKVYGEACAKAGKLL